MYEAKKFDLPSLDGISDESVKQHLSLYEGYVKNFNAISKQIAELAMADWEKNVHPVSELIRRRSFEFDGMRLHELYFSQFEGGPSPLRTDGPLGKALEKTYQPKDVIEVMTKIGNMRGPGWALLYYDREANDFFSGFAGEQHQGHFVTLPVILALDVWEHAFILDYGATGKGKYIDAFFKNLNWGVVEKRLALASA